MYAIRVNGKIVALRNRKVARSDDVDLPDDDPEVLEYLANRDNGKTAAEKRDDYFARNPAIKVIADELSQGNPGFRARLLAVFQS